MLRANRTLQRFYRWNAPIYDLTRWTILRGRRAAIDALRLQPGDRVLEVGCGTGSNFARLGERIGSGGVIVGVDLSCHMLRWARRRQRRDTRLIQADAARLPLGGRFDAVLMAYALTMIPEWRTALRCACALLEPGGAIVLLDFARPDPAPSPARAVLYRCMARNHVDAARDLKGALARCVDRVEELDPGPGYLSLFRGVKKGSGAWSARTR